MTEEVVKALEWAHRVLFHPDPKPATKRAIGILARTVREQDGWIEQLTSCKFSDRNWRVLKQRAEAAERERDELREELIMVKEVSAPLLAANNELRTRLKAAEEAETRTVPWMAKVAELEAQLKDPDCFGGGEEK